MDRRHIIEEAEFDISFDSLSAAREQEDGLASFILERLLPLADDIFNELAGDGRVFRMERLEIDLGDVDYPGFQEEMESRFREKLRSALIEKISVLAAAPTSTDHVLGKWQAGRGRLESFLETGRMAWDADRTTGAEIEGLLRHTLEHEGAAFARFLRASPLRDVVVRRLSLQFTDRFLADIARLFAPAQADRIGSLIGRAGEMWKRNASGLTEKEFKSQIWQRLIGEHLKPGTPDAERLVRDAVKDLFLRHAASSAGGASEAEGSSILWEGIAREWSGGGEGSREEASFLAPLRARLEWAFSEGDHLEIADVWNELRFKHGGLVRDVFMQRMGDRKLLEKLVAGLPEPMLHELLDTLSPQESGFAAALSRLPELHATEGAKNAAFWTYTLGYLHTHGRGFDRGDYVQGLVRHLGERGSAQRLHHAILEIAPEMRGVHSGLPGTSGAESPTAADGTGRAAELHERLMGRLTGRGIADGEEDLVSVIDELASGHPETLARLLRELQTRKIRADFTKLTVRESRRLVAAFTGSAHGTEFHRAIEAHAGNAQDLKRYFLSILDQLIHGQEVDLEAALPPEDAGGRRLQRSAEVHNVLREPATVPLESAALLRFRLEEALVMGRAKGLEDMWGELLHSRRDMLRDVFLRRLTEDLARSRLATGFTESMLRELVSALLPAEGGFIGTLAKQPELRASEGDDGKSIPLWEYTLAYLHGCGLSGYERAGYAHGLASRLADRGLPESGIRAAIVRCDPALGDAMAAWRGTIEGGTDIPAGSADAAAGTERAGELLRRLLQRLGGQERSREMAQELAELSASHPGEIGQLYRRLRSGEAPLDVSALTEREARLHVDAFMDWSIGGGGDDFRREIGAHAGRARSRQRYYQIVLEKLLLNRLVDLEEAMAAEMPHAVGKEVSLSSIAVSEPVIHTTEQLRGRLESAMAQGSAGGIGGVWDELMTRHGVLVRETFMRRMEGKEFVRKLVAGFPEGMLRDLVRVLLPEESGFVEALSRLPELRVRGSAKNEDFWAYTLGYLHERGAQGFKRAQYVRGLVRLMRERGLANRLPHAVVELAPGLRSSLVDLLADAATGTLASVPAEEDSRARELYEHVIQRLHGGAVVERDFVAALSEMETTSPSTLTRLQRQLQSGELRAEIGSLAANEARRLAASLIRLNLGVQGGELLRAVEARAHKAQDRQRYYRRILEGLIRNQVIDPETIADESRNLAQEDESVSGHDAASKAGPARAVHLRAVLQAVLAEGRAADIFAIWDELRLGHGSLVREVFMQRAVDETALKKLAAALPESMLLELLGVLAPQEAGFVERLSQVPELRGTGRSKNESFWAYTLVHLHNRGAQGLDRAGYVRGIARLPEQGGAQRLLQAMIEAAPELKEMPSGSIESPTPETNVASAPAAGGRAHELYGIVAGRLGGQGRTGQDFAAAVAELGKSHPEILARLHRQLQSGELRTDTGALDVRETRQLAVSLVRLNSGAQGGEFLRAIERHAGRAESAEACYRNILEKLIRGELIDLDEAANETGGESGRAHAGDGGDKARSARLHALLDAALSEGTGESVAAEWEEICSRHATLLSEVFGRRMGSESAREKTARGFSASMLEDMVRILAPRESGFIAALAAHPEFHPGTKDAVNLALWKYTLGHVHASASGGFDRSAYAVGLTRHWTVQGMDRAEAVRAIVRTAPELGGLLSGHQEPRADGLREGMRIVESARVAELLERVSRRMAGEARDGQDMAAAMAELARDYPETFEQLSRRLMSGESRLDAGELSVSELRQLVMSIAEKNAGGQESEFLRSIERHAAEAKSEGGYYRYVLERLLHNEVVDLDEAASESATGRADAGSGAESAHARTNRLRDLLDEALSEGRGEMVAAEWGEICDGEAQLLREVFGRRMGSENARKKTARGFGASMLEDMVRILAPRESGFIAALVAQPELHPGTNRGGNVAMWEYTLGCLHVAGIGGFDRARYAAGLMGHLAARGMEQRDVSKAIIRVAPELDDLIPGQQEQRAERTGDGSKPGEDSRATGTAQSGDAMPKGEDERADELLERVSQHLAGRAVAGQDRAKDMAELARDHPATFSQLLRGLRSGETRADLRALSAGEVRQLVMSMAGLNAGGQGSDFLRAIEHHAESAADAHAYYLDILDKLVRDEIVDLEEAACAGLPAVSARSSGGVPEQEGVAGRRNPLAADEAGSYARGAVQSAAKDSPQPAGNLRMDQKDGEGIDQEETMEIGEEVYIANAGMVLLTPYMPQLFRMLDLTDGPKFRDAKSAERAIHLLQFAVNESCDSPEFLLALNKILCGVVSGTPIVREIEVTVREKETIEGMLGAVIRNWTILGNTSVQGLRESFLQRKGRLQLKEDSWHLTVEQKGIDVLLDRLPWSFSIIRHPWMKLPVQVEWR